ncbi:MAG TPA: hypothetical protein VN635_04930 [Conexibacter sp.]|nr:hypothetical protein [Conexibacter sp.]
MHGDSRDIALKDTRSAALRPTSAALTNISWTASRELDLAVWLELGQRFGRLGRGVGWWIGDWLLYGNARYGEKYQRAAKVTGYDPQSLMNMVYVASRFEISRRREKLSWSHHAELAALPVEDQERWLDRAQELTLSVRCMRDELRMTRRRSLDRPAGAAEPDTPPPAHVVCPACGCQLPRAELDSRRRATPERPTAHAR